ncbi:cobyrinate a,c-diamide synthase [Actinacidiphila alni]|uniref:cobyrinate a,c-diamide synthase n=1 Tax=Actinacidiphila alni TaxID=380248 RepID=UPI0015A6A7E6|nr:cobyrinate a,c-diamide synthase [Actinacidiphila alni]
MTSTAVPRLVVAAPASGSGKTTVATGLMAAFAAAGLAVSPHKAGPDYIDPGYHALACGRPGRNLDPYLCGPERIVPLFAHGAAGCELALVEGVMGLFDGAAGQGELGSTAQVAKILRAPVVLVVDASSQSRSVAALVHGFASWDPGVRIGGVILNKVASDRHEALLRGALDESGVPVLGALRRAADVHVPSRHLGLVPAAERRPEAVAWVRDLAGRLRDSCDLPALLALARSAPPLDGTAWDAVEEVAACGASLPSPAPSRNRGSAPDPGPQTPDGLNCASGTPVGSEPHPQPARLGAPPGRSLGEFEDRGSGGRPPVSGRGGVGETARRRRPVVTVAGGAAFTFAYAEQVELLRAAGAELVTFDPLRDEALPEGTAGIVLGGGFPEIYAADLSANEPLRKAVAAFEGPIAAECAGLLYLARELDGAPMCGVLDAGATMTDRLTLGYREAVALGDSVLAPAGLRLRGHEFHRTRVAPGAGPAPAWGLTGGTGRRVEGFTTTDVHASYLHVHWAAEPSLARRFVERCAR